MVFAIRTSFRLAAAILALAGLAASERASAVGADLFAPSWETGQAMDAARALGTDSFYHVSPGPAPAGTLIRAEDFSGYALPPGVTSIRILYHTRTADDRDAVASGVVLLPYGNSPKGGWPLIAWSHGTTGVTRACAPSLMRSLFYNWEGLYEYVALGYAVVATDYAGLGTAGRHAYLDMQTNGADVIHSVAAARHAVPSLGHKWIAVGHSQGGLSVLGLAQLEGRLKDPDFLGTVAMAGASDLEDAIDSATTVDQPILSGLMAFIAFGMKTLYPKLDLRDVLTDDALSIYNEKVESGCSAASGAFASLHTNRMFKPGWKSNVYAKRFLERDRPGTRPIYGPIFLVGGGSDVLFTPSAAQKVFHRLCDSGANVQLSVYPGLGHDPLVYGSLRDQMAWIGDRFAGRLAVTDCAVPTSASWLREALDLDGRPW